MDNTASYTARKNAKRVAEKMIMAGTALTALARSRRGGATPPYQANHRATRERKGIMPDEMTFQLVSVQFGAEPVAVFRFGYERFELRARLGPGNLEHAIAAAAEVAASVFARWSHEALAFAQRVRAGEDGGPVRH